MYCLFFFSKLTVLILFFKYGEVDCWPMECPPLSCSDPVLTPGDCCARCHDDPCSLDTFNASTSTGQPCAYAGRLYDSGSHWNDPYNKCTACNCKVSFKMERKMVKSVTNKHEKLLNVLILSDSEQIFTLDITLKSTELQIKEQLWRKSNHIPILPKLKK